MTLMVGGPKNGEDLDYREHSHVVVPVARSSEGGVLSYDSVVYHRRKLIWFGRITEIWAVEGLSEAQLDDALMRLTLNEAGLKMWNAGKPRPIPLEDTYRDRSQS